MSEGRDRVERGYLLLPLVFEQEAGGDLEAAAATAGEAAAIGERFGDPDLFALAAHERGHILIRLGRIKEGLRLLDETMVAVTAGELSPIVSGIVYCGVILACQDAHEVRRAQEWTAALSGWCERQPDLVAFTGRCLVHRAELMQLHGAWPEALEEARRADERCAAGENPAAAGEACYRRGEIHRLLGDFGAAEEAYREASGRGREPQPGLALLRLAQGEPDAAAAAIRRALAETAEPGKRAKLLPAYVEIMLAVGDLEAARDASRRARVARRGPRAGGARGDGRAGAGSGRAGRGRCPRPRWSRSATRERSGSSSRRPTRWRGCASWSGSPAARWATRTPPRWSSTRRGRPSRSWARRRTSPGSARSQAPRRGRAHGLTERELEVLRLVAAGKTNKAIAAELVLSERTVDRHVSNIFAKLGVSSRAAATAYAYEHELL